MADVSGFGLKALLVATGSFPAGFPITAFADDSDPIEMESIAIADKAMGLNGDLVTWSKATPIPVNISVIAETVDDLNLTILATANKVGKLAIGAKDVINLTLVYPNGKIINLNNGKMTDAPFGSSVQSQGRLKGKTYKFVFESIVIA